MYPIDPPITGQWPFDVFPEAVEIDGIRFIRARRKQSYDRCVEQYRQDSPRDCMHLLVLDNGTYSIDHADEYNPDQGYPFRHFVVDHPKGAATVVAGAGALGVIGSVVKGALEDKRNRLEKK